MNNLILALQLMQSKMTSDVSHPTHCMHEELRVYLGVPRSSFTDIELDQLAEWGFDWASDEGDDEDGGFYSFRYGSC
jgi:hypothetical protein